MTSAPKSPSTIADSGPANTVAQSITLSPASGPSFAVSRFIRLASTLVDQLEALGQLDCRARLEKERLVDHAAIYHERTEALVGRIGGGGKHLLRPRDLGIARRVDRIHDCHL